VREYNIVWIEQVHTKIAKDGGKRARLASQKFAKGSKMRIFR
jgi:hypothetical protein